MCVCTVCVCVRVGGVWNVGIRECGNVCVYVFVVLCMCCWMLCDCMFVYGFNGHSVGM